jgi:uncharacterized protein
MKLHSPAPPRSAVNHGLRCNGYIDVNGRRLTKSFLLTPQRLIDRLAARVASIACVQNPTCWPWPDSAARSCCLGTGPRQRFPAPALLRPLIERRIGVEVMDSFAACRTYNILMAEGRDVAAAIDHRMLRTDPTLRRRYKVLCWDR